MTARAAVRSAVTWVATQRSTVPGRQPSRGALDLGYLVRSQDREGDVHGGNPVGERHPGRYQPRLYQGYEGAQVHRYGAIGHLDGSALVAAQRGDEAVVGRAVRLLPGLGE